MSINHSNNSSFKNISIKNNSGLDFLISQRKPIVIKPVSLPSSISVSLGKLVTSGYIPIH